MVLKKIIRKIIRKIFKKKPVYTSPPPKYFTPAPSGRQSVPPEFGGTQSKLPAPSSGGKGSSGGGGSSSSPQQLQQLNTSLQQSGFTSGEARALTNQQRIINLARQRGRGLSQFEARRIYGGNQGIKDLRSASRKIRDAKAGGYVQDLYRQSLTTPTRQQTVVQPRAVSNELTGSTFGKATFKFLDTFSGGRLTNRRLDKSQELLNKAVSEFETKYSGRTDLNEREFNRANSVYNELIKIQSDIDKARTSSSKPLEDIQRETSTRGGGKIANLYRALGGTLPQDTFKKSQSQSAGVGVALANAIITTGETPEALRSIYKQPSLFVQSIKQIFPSIKSGTVKRAKLYVINPDMAVAQVATETGIVFLIYKGTDKGLRLTGRLTQRGVTRLSPYFRKLETTPLGIRQIRKVIGNKNIELIEQRGTRIRKVDPIKAVKEAQLEKQIKPKPTLPKVNPIQKRLIALLKGRGELVTGSYAQNVFLKKRFGRRIADLDILSPNRPALMKAIRKKLGKGVTFKKKLRSIKVRYKGKTIADLVKLSEGEAGFVQRFGFARVNGLNVVRPQVRLASKVKQLGLGKKGKVVKDIELLLGKKGTPFKRPSFGGAYTGRQAKVGTRRTLTSSQSDLFKLNKIQQLRNLILRKKPSLKLKKWFYATPDIDGVAQARVTRLGLPTGKEASLIDLFSGKATLTKGKPTIFVLPKEKIFKSPKGINKNKIASTKGFVVPKFSPELEVVLGKGFLLKQGKRLGTTLIDGNRVSIIQLKKVKISKSVKTDIKSISKLQSKLAKRNIRPKTRSNLLKKLNNKQKSLLKKVKKETKIDYSRRQGRRYFPLKRRLLGLGSKALRRVPLRTTRRGVSPPIRRVGTTASSLTPTPRTPRRPRSPIRPLRTPSPPPRRPSIIGRTAIPPKRILFGKGSRRTRTLPKAVQTYNVFAKVGRKFVKVNRGKLTKQDALNRGSFAIDTTTAKTFKIVKAGKRKKVDSVAPIEKNYYQRASFKLREYRIRRGKKFGVAPKFIEKRRYGIDTSGEKRGLSIAQFLKQRGIGKAGRELVELGRVRRGGSSKPTRRRISPKQKKVMLKNLRKARMVLARRRR